MPKFNTDGKSIEPLKFVYDLPPISERKLAILKLVAKYTVIDPQQIQNRDYDFLNANHSLNSLFRLFVEQYRNIKDEEELPQGDVLKRAVLRAQSTPSTDKTSAIANTKADLTDQHPQYAEASIVSEDTEFSSIDWNDFVILETVEFFSADVNGTSNLSAPFTLEDLQVHRFNDGKMTPSEPMLKSALTGELISASQYNQHVRVLTLDPQYHKQKAIEEDRRATTNLDTENVAENLAILRQKKRKLMSSGE